MGNVTPLLKNRQKKKNNNNQKTCTKKRISLTKYSRKKDVNVG